MNELAISDQNREDRIDGLEAQKAPSWKRWKV